MQNMQAKQDNTSLLIGFFEGLVEITENRCPYLWHLLCQLADGKVAIVELDGCKIQLFTIKRKNRIRISIKSVKQMKPSHLKMDSRFMIDLMLGIDKLDNAILQQKILIYGSLEEALGIYNLVLGFLSEGPLNADLQGLWRRFASEWPGLQISFLSPPLLDYQFTDDF